METMSNQEGGRGDKGTEWGRWQSDRGRMAESKKVAK